MSGLATIPGRAFRAFAVPRGLGVVLLCALTCGGAPLARADRLPPGYEDAICAFSTDVDRRTARH